MDNSTEETYEFKFRKIKNCRDCPMHSWADFPDEKDWCNLQDTQLAYDSTPEYNDCPLINLVLNEERFSHIRLAVNVVFQFWLDHVNPKEESRSFFEKDRKDILKIISKFEYDKYPNAGTYPNTKEYINGYDRGYWDAFQGYIKSTKTEYAKIRSKNKRVFDEDFNMFTMKTLHNCTVCCKTVAPGDKFCRNCGRPIKESSEEET